MTAQSRPSQATANPESDEGSYAGWYIGGALIVAVIAVGLGLWFVYHP
jgi:hypothetical protein